MFLRLAETLTAFLTRLRNSANTLDVMERQRIVRLVVKDVVIGDDTLVIRHCIPIVAPSASGGAPPAAGNAGVPQNRKITFCVKGALSPLLSNLVLDEWDQELERRGHRFMDMRMIVISTSAANERESV